MTFPKWESVFRTSRDNILTSEIFLEERGREADPEGEDSRLV